MAFYLHRERYIVDEVPPKSIIKFPTLVSESLNRSAFRNIPPYKDMEDEEWQTTVVSDIYYHGCNLTPQISEDRPCENYESTEFDGAFDINLPGIYLLAWYASQVTAVSNDGRFFQIKFYNDETSEWETPSSGSRLLVSTSEFCVVINVTKEYFPEPNGGKLTLALFNDSDEPLFMNRTPRVKAGFALFGFNPVTDEQLLEINEYIIEITQDCCGMGEDYHILQCIKWQLDKLEAIERDQNEQLDQLKIDWDEFHLRFSRHNKGGGSDTIPTFFATTPSAINMQGVGLQLSYRRVGYIFHIWISGKINTQTSFTRRAYITPTTTAYNNVTHLPFLEFYNLPVPIVGTLSKVRISGTNPFGSDTLTTRYPVYVDQSGVYLIASGSSTVTLEAGSFLSFSIPIILEVLAEGG